MEAKSILTGVSEHDVVTVHNPLDTEFVGKVARSVVTQKPSINHHPTGNSEADAFMRQLRSDGQGALAHVQQKVVLKAGQTLRMPGDVARVVVRQLVKELMQREKATKRMADPTAVLEFEKRVVKDHVNMLENMSVESAEERLERQMNDLNKTSPETEKEATDEQAFPDEPNGSDDTPRAEGATTEGSQRSGGKAQGNSQKK